MQEKLQQFVEIWQQSESVREVMEKLGMNYSKTTSTAFRLRKHGVKLKKFKTAKYKNVNWEELAEYAKKLDEEEGR